MAELAIKGHPTRGEEVIKLLEMLGGVNKHKIDAIRQNYVYFIDMDNIIRLLQINQLLPEQYIVYSLEEFEEKFPYKVGDNVTHFVGRLLETQVITNMRWDSDWSRVLYYLDDCNIIEVEDILYSVECKTEQSKQKKIIDMDNLTITNEEAERNMIKIPEFPQTINLNQSNVNEIEVVLGDYEFVLKDGKTYFVKKNKYPKTYDKCCRVLGISDGEFMFAGLSDDEYNLFDNFVMLKRCRDAYWKIAGEQMGLDKPWEPDWDNLSTNHEFIKINKGCFTYSSRVLVFPTEEMRDEFYKNFKDLIERCKAFL